jgi:Phage Tail Collar Domain
VSLTEAIVLGYPGFKVTDPTDTVYLNNLIPVGSIYPYSGSMNREALRRQGWLVCDGKRYYAKDYNDLWTAIGQTYYGDGTIVSANGDQLEVTFSGGDPLGLVGGTGPTGEGLRIQYGATSNSSQPNGWFIEPVSGSSILFKGQTATSSGFASGGKVKVRGVDRGLETVFFVPDMRRRVPIGASLGDDLTGSAVPARTRGDVDGIGITAVGGTGDMFTTVNYIIRAKNEYDAVILTGHNHDLRYIRYDAPHNITSGSPNNLTDAQRSQFRQNAKVLSNNGPDVFSGVLSVSGTVRLFGNPITNSLHANLSTLGGGTAGSIGLTHNSPFNRKLYIHHYTDTIKYSPSLSTDYGLSVALAGVVTNEQKGGGFVLRGEGYHASTFRVNGSVNEVDKGGAITGPYYDFMILNGHAPDADGYGTFLPGSSSPYTNSGFRREWPSYGTGHKSLTGNNDTILRNSALKIRGGDHTRTAISLWNDNASDMTASVGGRINFFASQTGASGSVLQIPSSAPEFVGGIVAELIPASDGNHTREVSINIGGYSAGAAGILDTKALVVSKEDNSTNLGYKLNSLGTANAQGNYAVQISSAGTLSRSIDPIAMLGALRPRGPLPTLPASGVNIVGEIVNTHMVSGVNSVSQYDRTSQSVVRTTDGLARILLGTGRWIVYGNCQIHTGSGMENEAVIGSYMTSLQSGPNGEWLAIDLAKGAASLTAMNVTGSFNGLFGPNLITGSSNQLLFNPKSSNYNLTDDTDFGNCSYFGFAIKVED